ncbi:MAG: endonuclease III [Capsulimonadales bacterium]|nr:endonuclease III [Capsulimonadales bacterium]
MPERPPETGAADEIGEIGEAEKAIRVCDRLDAEYGTPVWRSHGEPLGTLIGTILSQHTSDRNSGRAYDQLRRAFPTWDAVRTAPIPEIAEAIRSGGLAEVKAPRIRAVLERLYEREGKTTLDFLERMPTGEAKAYLTGFPGVGPKTTACVLMFSLGRPVLPVDTHVFRVSHRLGLIPKRLGEAKAHEVLQALLPDDRVYAFHVHLIRHGRRVCTASLPRCGACVLSERCDYFRSGAASASVAPARGATAPGSDSAETLHGLPSSAE